MASAGLTTARTQKHSKCRSQSMIATTVSPPLMSRKPAFKDERARVTDAIFWMKTRGGWSETSTHKHTGAAVDDRYDRGSPIEMSRSSVRGSPIEMSRSSVCLRLVEVAWD